MIRSLFSNMLLFCLLFTITFSSNAATDPLKGKDLFTEKSNQTASWLGYIGSNIKARISNIPMFVIESSDTYAKVICIPSKLLDWNSKFKGKTSAEKVSITKTLVQGIQDRSIAAKQFSVFAFVKQVIHIKKNIKGNTVNDLTFPARIFVYVSSGTKWIKVSEQVVANIAEYGNLQYQTATATL